MKIALLFEGDIYHVRGEFTAIHNRIKFMQRRDDVTVDVFNFVRYYDKLTCAVRGNKQIERPKIFEMDGVRYNCYYYLRSYLDFITRKLFHQQTDVEGLRVSRFAEMFKDYDAIYAHSLYEGQLAVILQKKYGIPFAIMWHGSNIHTAPFEDKGVYKATKKVLKAANHNFFVSDELLDIAKRIEPTLKGGVSYNTIDKDLFYTFDSEKRHQQKSEFGIISGSLNVAFVGNYLPVKNVKYLPLLFAKISKALPNAHFHIIGNGAFENDFENLNLNIRFWGNQTIETMPKIYNCMDLVVMPSINEGLPMTCLEATACGCDFVGSRVGAIADVVGIENTVPHGEGFEEAFAAKCVEKLTKKGSVNITLPDKFDAVKIADTEIEIIKKIAKK